jgi:hypothetical protein
MNNEILMAFINENTNNSAVCSVDQYDMLNVNITADQLIDLVDVRTYNNLICLFHVLYTSQLINRL